MPKPTGIPELGEVEGTRKEAAYLKGGLLTNSDRA
jgi:hypothetical protein